MCVHIYIVYIYISNSINQIIFNKINKSAKKTFLLKKINIGFDKEWKVHFFLMHFSHIFYSNKTKKNVPIYTIKKTHTKSVNITTFYSASRTLQFTDGLDLNS